jgi:hypothetical protein
MSGTRHKVFISYHHADEKKVNEFVETFADERRVFISRGLGIGMSDDVVDSTDTDYVMRRIRELYLVDSTVTIVMIGQCTWARRYVDWEIQSSLRHGIFTTPNGLLGIKLSNYRNYDYPYRLNMNLQEEDEEGDCYARVIDYPKRKDTLANYIDDAFNARNRREHLIVNPRDRFINNRQCP